MAPTIEKESRAASEPRNKVARRRLKALVPFALILAALVLGTIPTFLCETLKITQAPEGDADLVVLAGPFSYQLIGDDQEWRSYGSLNLLEDYGAYDKFGHYDGTCVGYGALEGLGWRWDYLGVGPFEVAVDGTTRTVRAFSILTPLLGLFLLVKTVSVATFPGFSHEETFYRSWERQGCGLLHGVSCKFLGYGLLATSVLQAGTLLSLASSLCDNNPYIQYLGHLSRLPQALAAAGSVAFPRTCEPAQGYYFQIAAVVLWALAGASTVWIDDPAAAATTNDASPVVVTTGAYTARRQAILARIAGLREQIKRSVTDDQAAALRMALDTEITSLERLNKEQDASTGDPALDKILGNISGLCEQIKNSVTEDKAAALRMALDTEVANLERYNQGHNASTGDAASDVEACEEP